MVIFGALDDDTDLLKLKYDYTGSLEWKCVLDIGVDKYWEKLDKKRL